MNATSKGQGTSYSIQDLLGRLHRNGVTLWIENGTLRYRAPKGLLTADDLDRLRRSKSSIRSLLRDDAALSDQPARMVRRAHLSFNQLAHWNLRLEAAGGRPILQVASVSSLRGRLKFEGLERSVAEVVNRHEGLRTRIVVSDGVPQQEVSADGFSRLEMICLTSIPKALQEAEGHQHVNRIILEPVDYATSPLCRVVLLKLSEDDHMLIVALDHIISDGYSLNLLVQEIF